MVYIPRNIPDPASPKGYAVTSKEEILQVVREALEKGGGERISLRKFLAMSGMKEGELLRYHAGWNELLREAGCKRDQVNKRVEPARLLTDWGGVVRKLKGAPSWNEYRVHGGHNPATFVQHFGKWSRVAGEFRKFAARRTGWKDVMEILPPAPYLERAVKLKREGRVATRLLCGERVLRLTDRPVCGGRLGIEGMSRAPANEQGVVFLFGLLAARLGFEVESMQASFPDCEAKKHLGADAWQTVRIEFEYESRNFRSHGHDAKGCDYIVCWVHNWPECPKHLEVIELSDTVRELQAKREN